MKSSDIYLRAILQWILQPAIIIISLKITYIQFQSTLPRATDLNMSLIGNKRGHQAIICINYNWDHRRIYAFMQDRLKRVKDFIPSEMANE